MQESSTQLLLVRHGQTPWNAASRWQGHGDPGLSALGRAQAAQAAEALRAELGRPWDLVIASDLERARSTAEVLAAVLGLGVEVDVRLRELDVGSWTGLTRAEIDARDPETLRAFETGEPSIRPGGGESRVEIRVRTRDCVRSLVERFAGRRLIVVTHLGVIRALVPGAEPGNGARIPVVAEDIAERAIDFGRRPGDGPV
jgi:broad specificity phosphatase PhoE